MKDETKDDGGRMKDESKFAFVIHPSSFILHPYF